MNNKKNKEKKVSGFTQAICLQLYAFHVERLYLFFGIKIPQSWFRIVTKYKLSYATETLYLYLYLFKCVECQYDF